MSRLYVTTPIYYVNDVPHIGHAYTTVVADVAARAGRQRLGADSVYFLTGTDEHGSKIARAAEAAGVPVQEYVDRNASAFQQAWAQLDVSNDDFIRTSELRHRTAVQHILRQLRVATTPDGQPAVYEGEYEGLYCAGCEKFLLPSELVDGQCPDHKKPPEQLKEKNWFFRLSSYLKWVEAAVRDGTIKIEPERRTNEVLGLIEQLRQTKDGGDFSISRESVSWGIDLPEEYGAGEQKAYVWVDALTNYITALGYGSNDDAVYRKFWQADDSQVVHYIGQDIIKFHAVYWPALLQAFGAFPFSPARPLTLRVHGYFTIAGQKMSKSLGNVIPPAQLVERYGVDAARWLLATAFPFGSESDISLEQFDERFNAELANLLGNHASRVTDLVAKFAEGGLGNEETKLNFSNKDDSWSAAQAILSDLHEDSVLLQEQKPWNLAKTDAEAAAKVIRSLAVRLRDEVAGEMLPSIMPTVASKIANAFDSQPIVKIEPLFPRLPKG